MAQTIREWREARGWSQLQLANLLGVTPSTVYNWERGRSELSASKFKQLAQVLGVSMEEITLEGERAA